MSDKDTSREAFEIARNAAWERFSALKAMNIDAPRSPKFDQWFEAGWLAALSHSAQSQEAQPVACHNRANDYCKCSRNAMLCDGFGPAAKPAHPAGVPESHSAQAGSESKGEWVGAKEYWCAPQPAQQAPVSAKPIEEYPAEDQRFYRFWYGHMLNDLMQPPLCGVDHATARYVWDAALASQLSPVSAMTEEEIDKHLEVILRASGSSLRHYTLPKSISDMRDAMRKVLLSAAHSSDRIAVLEEAACAIEAKKNGASVDLIVQAFADEIRALKSQPSSMPQQVEDKREDCHYLFCAFCGSPNKPIA